MINCYSYIAWLFPPLLCKQTTLNDYTLKGILFFANYIGVAPKLKTTSKQDEKLPGKADLSNTRLKKGKHKDFTNLSGESMRFVCWDIYQVTVCANNCLVSAFKQTNTVTLTRWQLFKLSNTKCKCSYERFLIYS